MIPNLPQIIRQRNAAHFGQGQKGGLQDVVFLRDFGTGVDDVGVFHFADGVG